MKKKKYDFESLDFKPVAADSTLAEAPPYETTGTTATSTGILNQVDGSTFTLGDPYNSTGKTWITAPDIHPKTTIPGVAAKPCDLSAYDHLFVKQSSPANNQKEPPILYGQIRDEVKKASGALQTIIDASISNDAQNLALKQLIRAEIRSLISRLEAVVYGEPLTGDLLD